MGQQGRAAAGGAFGARAAADDCRTRGSMEWFFGCRMNLRTLGIGTAFAAGVALGYWFGTHNAQPRLASSERAQIAGLPAVSISPEVPAQMSAAATKVVEEARAQHFEELRSVQDVFT